MPPASLPLPAHPLFSLPHSPSPTYSSGTKKMPNDAPTMNVMERLNTVENTMTTGDSYFAQNLLNNVQNQQLFMDRLASLAQNDKLPGLQITSDTDGHAHQIKTDKMTVSDAGGQLSAHANHWKDAIWSGLSDTFSSANKPPVPVAKGSFEDCWNTKGTTDSCANRGIEARLKQAGAD